LNAGRPVAALLWIAFAVLVAGALWIVLGACGLAWPDGRPMLVFCPVDVAARQVDPALAAEQDRQEALERSVRDLEIALLERPYCAPPQPQAEPEPIPAPEPQPEPQPEPEPEPERADVPPPEPCPQRRPAEVVLVLDASNSMGWDFDTDPATEERLIALDERARRLADRINELQASGNFLQFMAELSSLQQEHQEILRAYDTLEREVDDPAKIDRIDVARQALTDLVEASPDDVEFALVSFNACGAPQRHGHYPPAERDRLLHRIGIIELGDHTALADALRALPQVIRGGQTEEEPVNVVLVSDGKDSCGGDPCAAARELKTQWPHVYINAIGISAGAAEVRCVSEATGGVFIQAENAEDLAQDLVQAAGQDLPEHCREPEPEPRSIEDAIRQGDEQALAGCWALTSDFTMESKTTGEPMPVLDWEICFAEDGRGSQMMSFTNGMQCQGRANAGFPDDSTLQIDDAGMTCPGFGNTIASTTICRLDGDGSAQCLTKDAGSSDADASTVTIRRKG
jgi:hypothetical protein